VRRTTVSVGESVRIIRELQELSQNQLAELTGIPQSTISAIQNDRVSIGVARAKVLARASSVTPQCLFSPAGLLGNNLRHNKLFALTCEDARSSTMTLRL
jgi:transcriptional regulator with XRE-family HTH domain